MSPSMSPFFGCLVWLVVFPVNKEQRSHTKSYNITMIQRKNELTEDLKILSPSP